MEEIRGFEPHPSDVMLFVKKWMSDPEPYRVITLVPASVCAQLRASFQQPVGNCERRDIGRDVVANISSKAPLCYKQGIISRDALAYLTGWIEGTLPPVPRPAAYRYLLLRRYTLQGVPVPPAAAWSAPARSRVITVMPNDAADSDSDQGLAEGPIGIEDE